MRDEGCVTILLFFLPFPFLFGFSPFSWSVFKIKDSGTREKKRDCFGNENTTSQWHPLGEKRDCFVNENTSSQWHPPTCHCERSEAVSSFWFLVASLWNPGGKRDGFSVDTTQRGGGCKSKNTFKPLWIKPFTTSTENLRKNGFYSFCGAALKLFSLFPASLLGFSLITPLKWSSFSVDVW